MEYSLQHTTGQQAFEFLQTFGPTALVLDAASSHSQAFAVQLARGGFDLLLLAKSTAPLQQLAARLRDHEGVNVTLLEYRTGGVDNEMILGKCRERSVGLLVNCSAEQAHWQQLRALGMNTPVLQAQSADSGSIIR